jgi:hypothetical protein
MNYNLMQIFQHLKEIISNHGDLERQKDRKTEGQRDRETERQRDRERQRDKETKRQRDRKFVFFYFLGKYNHTGVLL